MLFLYCRNQNTLFRFICSAEDLFKLISIYIFRLSLTLFFVREKYLGRKINLHFL